MQALEDRLAATADGAGRVAVQRVAQLADLTRLTSATGGARRAAFVANTANVKLGGGKSPALNKALHAAAGPVRAAPRSAPHKPSSAGGV
eukprot:22142-Prymnesium_polylepis.2